MADVTRIPSAIEPGDPWAAEHLLPWVYDGLRKLAASKMAQEASASSKNSYSNDLATCRGVLRDAPAQFRRIAEVIDLHVLTTRETPIGGVDTSGFDCSSSGTGISATLLGLFR